MSFTWLSAPSAPLQMGSHSLLIFGNLIHSFSSTNQDHVVKEASKRLLVVWSLERGKRCGFQGLYLKTILRQHTAYFETETTTAEVIGRMSGDTILIQDAMGEQAEKRLAVGKLVQVMVRRFCGRFYERMASPLGFAL
ncbi:hypothetical protein NL676_039496 [Syzygium grande]|nr:hypothetical protein NL676_039496 [Syzygium grande]